MTESSSKVQTTIEVQEIEPSSQASRGSSNEVQFRNIYESNLTYVWNSLLRLGVPRKDVEDVAHETFVSVFKRLNDYDFSRPVRPWLFGFAFRMAADYRKRAHVRYEVASNDKREPAFGGRSAEDEMVRQQERTLVLDALRTLSVEKSAVFIMMDIDGHSAPETAATLGVPLNTIYSRLRSAREEFTVAIERITKRKVSR